MAVKNLFLRKGKLYIGSHQPIEKGAVKDEIIGLIFTSFVVICPKIIIFSWVIATFRWWSVLFFLSSMLVLMVIHYLYAKNKANVKTRWYTTGDKTTSDDAENEDQLQGELPQGGKKNRALLKDSAFKTFLDMFGVRKNPISSSVGLMLSSIFILFILTCALPRSWNESATTLPSVSNDTFHLPNPDFPGEMCICHELIFEENDWTKQYFDNNFVCIKDHDFKKADTLFNRTTTLTQKKPSHCYDPIFFKRPSYASHYSPIIDDFPVISSCITFNTIENYQRQYKTSFSQFSESFNSKRFDESCKNQTFADRFQPCSEEIVTNITIVFSVMIIWMCFGVVAVYHTSMCIYIIPIAEFLLKKQTRNMLLALLSPACFGGLVYALYYLTNMLHSKQEFQDLFEDGLSRTNAKMRLQENVSESESICIWVNQVYVCNLETFITNWYYSSYKSVLKVAGICFAIILLLSIPIFLCISCVLSLV